MSQLASITDRILDKSSSNSELRSALAEFTRVCSRVGGVHPDPGFNAWAGDSYLASGVAINPEAAAHCVADHQRSVVFIRGMYAALHSARLRFPNQPLRVLYAGCGPYATLLLPLLPYFSAEDLDVYLLDIHQRSLDSVQALLSHFGLQGYRVTTLQADASSYQHPHSLHLVVTETMQKSLEQEPQVAITRNLAPQLCTRGLFLPERIDVELGLLNEAQIAQGAEDHHALTNVFTLEPAANPDPAPVTVTIPTIPEDGNYRAYLLTRIQVFGEHFIPAGSAEVSLPRPCPEITPLRTGETFEIRYVPGTYPTFTFENTTVSRSGG